MRKPTIKIAIPARNYVALENMAQTVIESITSNPLDFPSPSPSIGMLQAGLTTLKEAVATWGPAGARGSKKDLMNLRNAAVKMRNLLLKEAAYVANLVDLSDSAEGQATFINASGFPYKNERTPQGLLEPVRNLHRVISGRLNYNVVKLRWQKPLNVTVNANVKVYLVFRSLTTKFSDAVFVDAVTKTTFTDYEAVRGAANVYFIVPVNNAGRGKISEMEMEMVDVH